MVGWEAVVRSPNQLIRRLAPLLAALWLWPGASAAGGAKADFWTGSFDLTYPVLADFEPDPIPADLLLLSPEAGSVVASTVPLVEVRGQLGVGARHDVVLAVDCSGSAFLPSRADVDGDGTTGELRCKGRLCGRPTRWTTDFDDTVLAAEVRAATSLVGLLDPSRAQMGIVRFGQRAQEYKEIQRLDEIESALARFSKKARSGTDLIAALDVAVDMLQRTPPVAGAVRSVLLLSDGGMLFTPYEATEHLRTGIERVRDARVRVFTFGVGAHPEGPGSRLLAWIAESTGGTHTAISDPASVLHRLPMVSLSTLSHVELRNTTSGEAGRAIRVFPDGSFDGFAPLVAGENRLRISAKLLDGGSVEQEIELRYDKPEVPSAQDLEQQRELLRRLRVRRVETDLAHRAQVERRERLKQVTVTTE